MPRSTAGRLPWVPSSGRQLAVVSGLLYLPFVGFGYGTDIDITNVLRSGASLLDGDYRYSRPPGAFPYEALVGVLDRLGGHVAVNAASVLAAIALLWQLAAVVEERGGTRRGGIIAVAVVGTQPWFWMAATSLGDYAFALAFLLAGVRAVRAERALLAGLAFGTAIGFRSSTAVLVLAILAASVLPSRPDLDPPPRSTGATDRRRVVGIGFATVLTASLWFIPAWLSVGRTTRFLINEFQTSSLTVQLARWGIKNVAFFGVLTLVVLVVRADVLIAPLRSFRDDHLVRVAVLAGMASELLFLRFPWKPVHLLPVLLCVAVLLGRSERATNRLVVVVVASNLALALVSVSIAEPDVADAATTGRLRIGITRGVVVNDLACRTDPAFDGDWPDLDEPAADFAAVGAFACQARSWRAGAGPTQR